MKNFKITIWCAFLTLSSSTFVYSQSNYEKGFKAGYANGYCFDMKTDCRVSVPEYKGKYGKFRDGYALGFERALKARTDISYKDYYKEYLDLTNALNRQYPVVTDANVFTTVLEKINYYYLNSDYEKVIGLSELLSKSLGDDYRPNMYKGLSLIELEDFKQGKRFLTWALRNTEDPGQKKKLTDVIEEVDNGTYKNNKMTDETGSVKSDQTAARTSPPANKKTEPAKQKTTTNSEYYFFTNGKNKFSQADYAGAVADLTTAIEEKQIAEAYYLRALAKEHLGDAYGAANDFAYLIKQTPNNSINYADVYLRYGNILLKQKKYDLAIAQMDALIKLDNKNALGFYHRGIAKINSGEKENGCLDLSKAGELGYKEAYEAIKKLCE